MEAAKRDPSGRLVPSLGPGDCQVGAGQGPGLLQRRADGHPAAGRHDALGHDLGYTDCLFATPDLSKRMVYSVGVTGGTPAPAFLRSARVR
ncbi:hypothetical protein O1L44_02285 [Streptomyces noursei]|uniref:hypothetical protein n=1 Tax=Streptomyces noursei TaxID=1971 RepID=UPI00081CF1FC|nr:hypothetical protein SNOUR_07380 [Streptomyces noursei ATCC 11455]MCZ0992191.1 hypothetical protein [Streptomyces noursei]